ncbi:Os06g0137100 [Oryza sativa Japonica Group]|uniref:Os06g0137100 protein n=1 Tax=Oryza sativa subsp. japonica TaxID=39947 RepID=C7J3G3_ORYSJ|nr:Os06g0137100 [Oryza sativa Japonica Group]|eukprot:NP_001174589.1 Os06g0137100 [Oryza sativa Japonica Group]
MTMSSISYFYPLPDKLQTRLRGEGGIKALLGMVKCGHPDVLAQVARGIANFAKCESRAATQGNGTDQSNVHMFSLMSLSLIVLWYEWVTHSTFQRCHARDIFCFSDCNGT